MATRAPVLARELEHTADLGFEIEAPTLPLLFERAGLALIGVMVDPTTVAPRMSWSLEVVGAGVDELLHDWLQALLVQVHTGGLLARELDVRGLDDGTVRGTATGESLDPARHRFHTEVKGVTWHQLAVTRTADGWRARVILDV